jgi:uncharacterized repeat protein (TIGR03803 family)
VLHFFNDSMGFGDSFDPVARGGESLYVGSAGDIFAISARRGGLHLGEVLKLAPGASAFTVLRSDYPTVPLSAPDADSSGTLFAPGAADFVSGFPGGAVYKLAPDSSSFEQLHAFDVSFLGDPDVPPPFGGFVIDRTGNLYGATRFGGAYNFGSVFKLAPDRTFTILHSFAGGTNDGRFPVGGLVADRDGNLYGMTQTGGTSPCLGAGCGVVYRIAPDGSGFDVLHSFSGMGAEYRPIARLVVDRAGILYGTTQGSDCGVQLDCKTGTVFKLAPDRTYSVLHTFTGVTGDGGGPSGGLIADSAGTLYGATIGGGASGEGTVYKLAPDGTGFEVLHAFSFSADNVALPIGRLVADSAGNLYGMTRNGFSQPILAFCNRLSFPCGAIYKLSGTGFVTETPAALKVTPATGIVASAARGGKIFSASVFDYLLGATSGSVKVEVSGIPSWLSPSFASANVTAASPLTDTFSLTNLESLARGTYNATISFTNTTNNQGSTTRSATLRIYEWRDCLKGGWESIASPPGPFPNQGRCVAYFGHLLSSR